MLFQKGQKILFIGDSITDADRYSDNVPYGTGYMSIVRDLITARYPELGLTFVNRGISGNTTRDLSARWGRDVLDERPDWLSVKIGINDVWRAFGEKSNEAVPVDEYVSTLRHLLQLAKERTGARLILTTPYMIEADRNQPMRAEMDRYGDAVKRLAAEFGAVFVDSQAAFDDVLRYTKPEDWAEDQVHPNRPGHAVIALAFLRAVGFEM